MFPFLRLAVIGDPVAHSKSPALHTAFLREAERAGTYEAIHVAQGNARLALQRLFTAGYVGLNVTTPLKEEVLKGLSSQDLLVEKIEAANTLIRTVRGWHGANTDGIGACSTLESALTRQGRMLFGARVLVLGCGPTARAAIAALTERGAEVGVWNRTTLRAVAVSAKLGACAWQLGQEYEAVLSTLPPHADIPGLVLESLRLIPLVVDANYGPRATLGAQLEREVVDGSHMLAAQAQASFARWLDLGEREI